MSQALRLELPKLYDYQSDVLLHSAKIKTVIAGRRSGKSYMASVAMLATSLAGGQVYCVTPNYSNSSTIWKFITKHIRPLKQQKLARANKAEMEITFPSTNGFIKLATSENQAGIRGQFADLIVLDELAYAHDPDELYHGVCLPMLADVSRYRWEYADLFNAEWRGRFSTRSLSSGTRGRHRTHEGFSLSDFSEP